MKTAKQAPKQAAELWTNATKTHPATLPHNWRATLDKAPVIRDPAFVGRVRELKQTPEGTGWREVRKPTTDN